MDRLSISEQSDNLDYTYDILKTSQWIISNKFERVALQFPDILLGDSHIVCERVKQLTTKQIYIAVDTTYSNCCIDEISAKHVEADAIVHYGHACLSACNSNVFFVHPKSILDIGLASNSILTIADDKINTIIFYHTSYDNVAAILADSLKSYTSIFIAKLKTNLKQSDSGIFGREITNSDSKIQDLNILDDCQIVYIGDDDQTVFNLAITVKTRQIHILDPITYNLKPYTRSTWLKRRRYVIEKCKDAKNIGILVCTLSIANFTSIITRLRDLIRLNNKKSFVLTVGKPNVAKLANVYEIDVFVLIACPENDLYMCREFLQPIAYPYELELALNQLRDQYSTDYVTDFNSLLINGKNYCELLGNIDNPDVSLLTGGMRNNADVDDLVDLVSDSSKSVVKRDEWAITELQIGNALSERLWQGLEQKLGETTVEKAQMGRSGIASGYKEEPL
ncbi:diphthamide biosynthesis 2 [Arctopsyche grandis]|uniref:diphthamide biosynthesis 2 n=1 Tax=Arctopsyche grandis TaxID=121162 RepID=UPI00406D66B1